MRYFVRAVDGNVYGPVDLAGLKAWVAEGRISPDTVLVEDGSGQHVPARYVPGLFGGETPQSQPQFARPHEFARAGDDGSKEVVLSFVCSALTFFICGLFCIGGIIYAKQAIRKGHRNGPAALIVAWIFTALWVIVSAITLAFLPELIKNAGINF